MYSGILNYLRSSDDEGAIRERTTNLLYLAQCLVETIKVGDTVNNEDLQDLLLYAASIVTEGEEIISSPFSRTIREAMSKLSIEVDDDLSTPESIGAFSQALMEIAKERREKEDEVEEPVM